MHGRSIETQYIAKLQGASGCFCKVGAGHVHEGVPQGEASNIEGVVFVRVEALIMLDCMADGVEHVLHIVVVALEHVQKLLAIKSMTKIKWLFGQQSLVVLHS